MQVLLPFANLDTGRVAGGKRDTGGCKRLASALRKISSLKTAIMPLTARVLPSFYGFRSMVIYLHTAGVRKLVVSLLE